MINVHCQHQLKETGKEITDLFERFKVWHSSVETPGGVGGGVRKKYFLFESAENTKPAVSH